MQKHFLRALAASLLFLFLAPGARAQSVYNALTSTSLPAHLVGNGVTDDLAALRADINYMRFGHPGVLYLPENHYRLDYSTGNTLSLPAAPPQCP